jgi:hypothetical protein
MGLFGLTEDQPRKLRIYSAAYVFVEGTLLCQEASVTLEKTSNASPMFTLGKGLAGVSQGAGLINVTVDSAVPSYDFEFSPDYFLRTGNALEIGVVMGGRQTVCKGFITDASYSHSVNDSSKLTFKLVCQLEDFE